MQFSALDSLRLMLASKGMDAQTSDELLETVMALFESAASRNRAQEIAHLTGAASDLVALAGTRDTLGQTPDNLRLMAGQLVAEVDMILSGEDEDEDEQEPAVTSPPVKD